MDVVDAVSFDGRELVGIDGEGPASTDKDGTVAYALHLFKRIAPGGHLENLHVNLRPAAQHETDEDFSCGFHEETIPPCQCCIAREVIVGERRPRLHQTHDLADRGMEKRRRR